jgi:hypothetical protein
MYGWVFNISEMYENDVSQGVLYANEVSHSKIKGGAR